MAHFPFVVRVCRQRRPQNEQWPEIFVLCAAMPAADIYNNNMERTEHRPCRSIEPIHTPSFANNPKLSLITNARHTTVQTLHVD